MTMILMVIIALGMTSLGVVVAAKMKSLEGFPVIMNFLLLPMLFLSGAMFPLQGLPGWMTVLTRIDPLSYGVDAMRSTVLKGTNIVNKGAVVLKIQNYPLGLDILVVLGVALLFTILAVWRFKSIE